jgi:addiction module HigA family antidote
VKDANRKQFKSNSTANQKTEAESKPKAKEEAGPSELGMTPSAGARLWWTNGGVLSLGGATGVAKLKPIHPCEILREEFMIRLGLNGNAPALALHVPAPSVYEIIHEKRGNSPEMALRLGVAFKTTPDFWLNLR